MIWIHPSEHVYNLIIFRNGRVKRICSNNLCSILLTFNINNINSIRLIFSILSSNVHTDLILLITFALDDCNCLSLFNCSALVRAFANISQVSFRCSYEHDPNCNLDYCCCCCCYYWNFLVVSMVVVLVYSIAYYERQPDCCLYSYSNYPYYYSLINLMYASLCKDAKNYNFWSFILYSVIYGLYSVIYRFIQCNLRYNVV